MDFSVKVEVERQVWVVSEVVDLCEDIQVGQVHLQHAA